MEVFNFLVRVKDTFTNDEFTIILHQLSTKRFSVPVSQVCQQMRASFRNPARLHLRTEFECMLDKSLADPKYEMTVTRVAENFGILRQGQIQLPRSEFFHFVECFAFDQAGMTDAMVMTNLEKLKKRIAPLLRDRLDAIMEHQQHNPSDLLDTDDGIDMFANDGMEDDGNVGMAGIHHQPPLGALSRRTTALPPTTTSSSQQPYITSPSSSSSSSNQLDPGMVELIQQAYGALHNNQTLCQHFMGILDFDQMNGIAFTDSIISIHEWILTVDPSLWDPLFAVLERMQTYQESTANQFELQDGAMPRRILGDEIEQGRVQHLFSNLSM
ncbi:hypothetical protein BCR42DRAFT_492810 [Absidia repens]|uniref:Uncharacterized protein n=1 Tax=Absidia repens TaxID=90262 RepID=A0A1X2ID06_9FUNG|nr:hypothetical protein BCR42DRAFT_492810 [Absidia repens]